MNADMRCLSVVLLLALLGCGSESDPPKKVGNKPTENVDVSNPPEKVEESTPHEHVAEQITIEQLEMEREAVAAIKELLGTVSRSRDNLSAVDLSNTRVSDAGLEHLKGLNNLVELDLTYTKVTDAGLEHLRGLTNLKELYLGGTQVTDSGLEHLRRRSCSASLLQSPGATGGLPTSVFAMDRLTVGM